MAYLFVLLQEQAENLRVRSLFLFPGPGRGKLRESRCGVRRPGSRHFGQCVPRLQRLHFRLRSNRWDNIPSIYRLTIEPAWRNIYFIIQRSSWALLNETLRANINPRTLYLSLVICVSDIWRNLADSPARRHRFSGGNWDL